jgi:ABC-2 type transport system permease protein
MMFALVENEMLKLLRRRRFRVVLALLLGVTALVAYAQWRSRSAEGGPARRDWREQTQHRIVEMQNHLRQQRTPDTYRRWLRSEVVRLQYSLDHGFDPAALTGASFSRNFVAGSAFLLLPLLVGLFAADLVSSEFTEGTIKLLLTRPARRWKVLTAKVAALFAAVTITIVVAAGGAYLLGGLAFGWKGWGAPVLAGFRFARGEIDLSAVGQIPLWRDALAVWGLAWYAGLCVSAIALLLSVVFRSTAAALGTLLAAVVTGTILPRMAGGWHFARWIFVTNLPLPDYYSGSPPPVPDMTLAFSVGNLGVWAVAALVVAYAVFCRRDVLG